MSEKPTLPRPSCRVSVLDEPGRGWTLDIADLLAGDTPRDARQTLNAVRARPAALSPVFPDDLHAAIASGVAIEIEDTGVLLDGFLTRVGGTAGFDQWSALVREERRLQKMRTDWLAEHDEVARAELHSLAETEPAILVDRTGRYGAPEALIAQAAWEAGTEPVEADPVLPDGTAAPALAGRIAPYLWGGHALTWYGPHGVADAARCQAGDAILAWLKRAWQRECPQEWDAPHPGQTPDLDETVARWRARGDGPDALAEAVRQMALRGGHVVYRRNPGRLYTVFARTGRPEILRWLEEARLEVEQRIAEIPRLWREPVEPGVRHRWTRCGVEIRTDCRTGAVVWVQAGPHDPLGVLENGPFLTLELALEDIAARARPEAPAGGGTEEIA